MSIGIMPRLKVVGGRDLLHGKTSFFYISVRTWSKEPVVGIEKRSSILQYSCALALHRRRFASSCRTYMYIVDEFSSTIKFNMRLTFTRD